MMASLMDLLEVFDMSTKREIALGEALRVANDPSIGYSQDADERFSTSRDCSSLVILAWEYAGVPVYSKYGATYTGNMKKAFLAAGFIDVTSSINLKTGEGLLPADVLLRSTGHTGMSSHNGMMVHAQSNEKGKTTGGKKGDQTGREIFERKYYNSPWDTVLRYPEEEESSFTITKILRNVKPNKTYDKEVAMLQTALVKEGYLTEPEVDGLFWDDTEAAVIMFQGSNGLVKDGIVGASTIGALGGKLEKSAGYLVEVVCIQLNIRSGPGKTSQDVGDLYNGDKVTIVEEVNGWGRMSSGKGWIRLAAEYTKRV